MILRECRVLEEGWVQRIFGRGGRRPWKDSGRNAVPTVTSSAAFTSISSHAFFETTINNPHARTQRRCLEPRLPNARRSKKNNSSR